MAITGLGKTHPKILLRRLCVLVLAVSLLLYLPTLFYLTSSFSENPEQEAYHAAIDVADSSERPASIPKIIHQIWMGNRKPPARYVRCAKSWKNLHGYHYRLWNETSIVAFLRERHPYFLQRWHGYKYTMNRVDTTKYFLLFTFGGIFADMDVCSVSPDPVDYLMTDKILGSKPDRRVVLVKGQPAGVNPEIMISPPRHPFFKHCLRSLYNSDRRYVLPYLYMMCVGGPCFLTGAYKRYSLKNRHILLMTYQQAQGRIFTPVKGGEWYTWDSKLLIEWIYFGIGHAHIVPVWLSSFILAIILIFLMYCLKRKCCSGEVSHGVTWKAVRWARSRFVG